MAHQEVSFFFFSKNKKINTLNVHLVKVDYLNGHSLTERNHGMRIHPFSHGRLFIEGLSFHGNQN